MSRVGLLAGRLRSAGPLGGTTAIHIYLWGHGYRALTWIGPLFLLDAGLAALLAIAVLTVPAGQLRWAAAAGAAVELGTVLGLFLAATSGLFGFVESTRATLFWPSVLIETLGAAASGTLAITMVRPHPGTRRRDHPTSSGRPARAAHRPG